MARSLPAAPLALSVASLLWAQGGWAFELTDALKGSTLGIQSGGQLGDSGWTTTGTNDQIRYEVPRLVEGSFEVTVSGLTVDKIPASDHEIFSMYEAGYDLGEPLNYNPQFRNNAYKVLLRIYGQKEASRVGQQKFLMVFCPLGAPGYVEGDCPCAAGAYDSEPFGGDGSWDGSPQTLRVEWTKTSARYLRNGQEILSSDWSSTPYRWGPETLHMMLGSPRNVLSPDVAMPVGITFSDLKIAGTEGEASPVCELGQAGSGGASGEGGASAQGGQGGQAGDAGAGGSGGQQGGSAGSGGCSSSPLSAGPLEPSSGQGLSHTFKVRYDACDDAQQLRVVQYWVGDEVDPQKPQVAGGFENGMLYLADQTCTPGDPKVLKGAYGSLDCAASKVLPVGNDLVVDWALSFDPQAFSGTHGFFADSKDKASPEHHLGWTKLGTWTVAAGAAGAAGAGGGGTGGGGGGGQGGTWTTSQGGAAGAGKAGSGQAGQGGAGASAGQGGAGGGKGSLGDQPAGEEAGGDEGGCGCRAAGGSGGKGLGLLALAAVAAVRRRRR